MIKKIIKENIFYIVTIIILIVLFTIIKNSQMYNKILLFDYKIIAFRNKIMTEHLTLLFKNLTFFGDYYIPIVIIVCIFIFNKNKYHFYVNCVNYVTAILLSGVTKLIVNRPRPPFNLIPYPDSYSFPSGHTLTAIVFYTFLCYIATKNRKTRFVLLPLIIIIILSISLSRIYLGVHYLSDVIGAVMLAIPLLLMNINIYNKHFKEELK